MASADAKDAFLYLIGLAASDERFRCYGELKGVVRDFRYYDQSGKQPFAFIVNKDSLLFYLRAPAVRSGDYQLAKLKAQFSTVGENRSGEWTVRIGNLDDARRIWLFLGTDVDSRSGDAPTMQNG